MEYVNEIGVMESKRSHIPIRDSQEEDATTIYFPCNDILTLDDLRSAFPNATSLRYKDDNDDKQHHILCRENIFLEPEASLSGSRYGIFESYRRQVTSQQRQRATSTPKDTESGTTMLTVGHGHFKSNGVFSKISMTSLSGCGGVVVVGPFNKTGNTSNEIKVAAYEKFCQQNRSFRAKFKSSDIFHLVYPDGSLVDTLPGTSEEFSLLGYRNSIDPKRRFNRLRLYLCTKGNFRLSQQVENVSTTSSSSEDDLPMLYSRRNYRSANTGNDTLPLTIEVVFHHNEEFFTENLPNNSKVQDLMTYVKSHLNLIENAEVTLKPLDNIQTFGAEERIMELTTESKIHVAVYTNIHDGNNEEERNDMTEMAINTNFDDENICATKIAETTLQSMNNVSEPTAVIRHFREQFLRGRPLDILDENSSIEGEVTPLYVSRYTLYNDAIEEITYAENIRFPLCVTFHNESVSDFGGPRKEFLTILLKQIKDELLREVDGKVELIEDLGKLARKEYFYAGIYIGISVIEGGPLADFLVSILDKKTEARDQLVKGLARTGIMQLFERKPSIKYLFMTTATVKLTVHKLLSLFTVKMSEEGTSDRILEEKAYRNFIRYTRDVFAGTRNNVTLEKMLQFVTGSPVIPVLGYDKDPSVYFSSQRYPTASTCIYRLYLPKEETAFEDFDLAFVNAYFGLE